MAFRREHEQEGVVITSTPLSEAFVHRALDAE
jgi:hypothetical protein